MYSIKNKHIHHTHGRYYNSLNILCHIDFRGEVRTFLQLDAHLQTTEDTADDSCEKVEQEETLNLGPSERI